MPVAALSKSAKLELRITSSSSRVQFFCQFFEPFQSRCTHMMFDPFGVDRSRGFIHPDRQQKSINNLVPLTALDGQLISCSRERDRFVGLGHQQPLFLQSINDSIDRHMADRESLGQIGHPALPGRRHDIRHRLDIVFGSF